MTREPKSRSGCVLIVEDEVLLALRLEALVEGLGYEVIGPAPTLERAQDLAGKATVDAALLDINLGNETVFPLAQSLLERGVPIAFATAQARSRCVRVRGLSLPGHPSHGRSA